jgi:hypothetical protein
VAGAPRPRFEPPARPRLKPWQERFVYAVVAALVATGAGWLVCHFLLAAAGDLEGMPHRLEPLWLELHAAAGMFSLVLVGILFEPHLRRAWTLGRGRASGGTLAGAFVFLAATGYGLYYVGDELAREWISVSHWAIGLAFPIALAVHVVRLRTRLRRVADS